MIIPDPIELHRRLAAEQRVRRTIFLPGYARAAVLVPVVYRSPSPEFLLTRRTDTVDTHKGQISFPGGVVDDSDASPENTALRETLEEVGIESQHIRLAGLLDDHATPTGFVITPVVGILEVVPEIHPNTDEVAEILWVPVEFFADERNARREDRMVQGELREVWHYTHGGHTVWGATAAMIRLFLHRAGMLPPRHG